MKTEIERPKDVIIRMMKFGAEAAEAEWWDAVQGICETTLENLREISVNYWGKEDSGIYPIIQSHEQDDDRA